MKRAITWTAAMWTLAALPVLGGCSFSDAHLQLLDGLETALGNVADGQQVMRRAVEGQLVGQQEALDRAFEADLRHLAAPASQPDGPAVVELADVLEAKRLYDQHRAALSASQVASAAALDRLDNNLSAGRRMVAMLRQLTVQHNVLAGQVDLASRQLLSAAGPAGANP